MADDQLLLDRADAGRDGGAHVADFPAQGEVALAAADDGLDLDDVDVGGLRGGVGREHGRDRLLRLDEADRAEDLDGHALVERGDDLVVDVADQDLVDERLAEVTRRVGENLQRSTEKAAEGMTALQERLAVIDAAQKNLADLSAEVVSLQDILSNKQARGAIGQTQMEDLVRNMLPPGAYGFQVTLSNGKRADCVIHLPNPPGMIAVDSKYPHEAYMALTNAKDDISRKQAEAQFRANVLTHIRDIADKYIIPGETADSAIMFVPAESVFATLHDQFGDVVEQGFRRRVYIVSPTTLMATLNTVRAVLKDAQMREQAHLLQEHIGKMMEDVQRLDDRVRKLGTHFSQTQADVDLVLKSTERIVARGEKIADIELEAPAEAAAPLLKQVGAPL